VEATGEVFGDAPNVAARVQAAAEPGSVLVTVNVQRQVAGLFVAEEQGARELKGVTEPVQLFRIVRASGARRRSSGRTLTPFVGLEEELALLARRWDSVRSGEGQLVLIVGEPGLGKSRLIEEFHARLARRPIPGSNGAPLNCSRTPRFIRLSNGDGFDLALMLLPSSASLISRARCG
jgi:hypothetical protein